MSKGVSFFSRFGMEQGVVGSYDLMFGFSYKDTAGAIPSLVAFFCFILNINIFSLPDPRASLFVFYRYQFQREEKKILKPDMREGPKLLNTLTSMKYLENQMI